MFAADIAEQEIRQTLFLRRAVARMALWFTFSMMLVQLSSLTLLQQFNTG